MTSPTTLLKEADLLQSQLAAFASRWECEIDACDGLPHEGWLHHHARTSQREPDAYRMWALVTGRGFGKTRTGAETVKKWINNGARHVAVIAKTDREVRSICFDGPAGLLAVFDDNEIQQYRRSSGDTRLFLKTGGIITAFTSETPDNLRGYAFDGAWLDEYSSWPRQTAQTVLDMVWFCLREAPNPRVIVTTTPKPVDHVKTLLDRAVWDEAIVVTKGATVENLPNLGPIAVAELQSRYGGTRLGRQELEGEMLEDVEGALWTWSMIEDWRVHELPENRTVARVVMAIDPAITNTPDSDETGIVTACATKDGHFYVLADASLRGSPDTWARAAVHEYERSGADCIYVEANQGGDAWQTLIAQIDPTIAVRKVHAGSGKRLRAEPIAALYEQGRVHHVGSLPVLESQMVTWTPYDNVSPDRLDALVWALAELSAISRVAPTVVPGSLEQANPWAM